MKISYVFKFEHADLRHHKIPRINRRICKTRAKSKSLKESICDSSVVIRSAGLQIAIILWGEILAVASLCVKS